MSGLCGIVHFDGAPVRSSALQSMAEAAVHRGPDGVRHWREGCAGLTHLALDIAPEGQRARQPWAEGPLALTADVRLDNRDTLIGTLGLRDRPPREIADAALLLAAYRRWGTGCAEHVLGDFAFAIWDAQRQRLFAARDAMAMRPLYYRTEGKRFLFASEVKQILAAPGVSARLCEPAVADHLAARFRTLDRTFYEGIAQLPPGHALVADASGCRTWRYWDVDASRRIRYDDEREYAEHFFELFEEAVRCRLRSEKPVGLMLSGGIDSTCVAATAGNLLENSGEPCTTDFRTYSWAYEKLTQCDERAVSDPIVERYGLSSTPIDAEAAAPMEHYPADTPDPDEPFAGAYDVLLKRLLTTARAEGTRQMLSGHRGDLVVGEWIFDYLSLLRSGRLVTLARALQAHTRRTGMPAGPTVRRYLWQPIRHALWPKERAAWLRGPVRRLYRTARPAPPQKPYPSWIRPGFAERNGLDSFPPPQDAPPGLQGLAHHARRQRYHAVLRPLHMRVATCFERCCARAGLAYADPWSDRRLAEFAVAVPPRALCRAGANKRIARTAMREIMPEQARQNAGKTSPKPLYERGLRDRARKTVRRLLSDSHAGARGYIGEDVLRAYYERYLKNETEDERFWYALTLEMWLRGHHEATASPSHAADSTTHEANVRSRESTPSIE